MNPYPPMSAEELAATATTENIGEVLAEAAKYGTDYEFAIAKAALLREPDLAVVDAFGDWAWRNANEISRRVMTRAL